MNLTVVLVAGMALGAPDSSVIDVMVQRVRAMVGLLRDGEAALLRSLPVGWTGAGHDAAVTAAGELRGRLAGLADSLETVALLLAGFAAALRSLQAQVATGRRLVDAGTAGEPVARALQLAEDTFQQADPAHVRPVRAGAHRDARVIARPEPLPRLDSSGKDVFCAT